MELSSDAQKPSMDSILPILGMNGSQQNVNRT
jgi:hypothetical protein